jgi:hypothetical protein
MFPVFPRFRHATAIKNQATQRQHYINKFLHDVFLLRFEIRN